jgi:hypothetical protein
MSESERLQRYQQYEYDKSAHDKANEDEVFASKIRALLNDPKLDKYCMVDAYYYDFSVLPKNIQGKFYRDMYLIYGITTDGEMITKWVERYDLD